MRGEIVTSARSEAGGKVRLELGKSAGEVGDGRSACLSLHAESRRAAHAKDIYGEAVVDAATLADLPAAIADRASDAPQCARGDILRRRRRRQHRVPGGGKARGVGPRAQAIGGLPAPPPAARAAAATLRVCASAKMYRA